MQRAILVAVVAVISMTSLPACVETNQSMDLLVRGNLLVDRKNQCRLKPESTEFLSMGLMDVSLTNTYLMFPQVENRLPSTLESTEQAAVNFAMEGNAIMLTGYYTEFDMDFDFLVSNGLTEAQYNTLTTEHYDAAGLALDPGDVGGLTVKAIPQAVGSALREYFGNNVSNGFTMYVTITLEGMMHDGTVVHSNAFTFPVDVCYGCGFVRTVIDCTDLASAQDMNTPCIPGQDFGTDCRFYYLMYVQSEGEWGLPGESFPTIEIIEE